MPADPEVAARLDLALNATQQAAELIMGYYQRPDLAVDRKRDRSPVTAADRGAEQLLRDEILKQFPDDGVLGEEFGETAGRSGFRWILDPVDGTKAFVHGVPLFGTLVGIEHAGVMAAGVCGFPALNEVMYAASGQGAWWIVGKNPPRRMQVSTVARLEEAVLLFTEIEGYVATGRFGALESLCRRTRLSRGWGDCYGHMLVASGRADVMLDPQMNPWDSAALIPIVQEAGGHHVGWNGETSIHAGDAVSVNASLRDQVLQALR